MARLHIRDGKCRLENIESHIFMFFVKILEKEKIVCPVGPSNFWNLIYSSYFLGIHEIVDLCLDYWT